MQRTAGSACKGREAAEAAPCYACAVKLTRSCSLQEDHLRRAADGARRRRDAAEAAATPDERIALNAAKAERQKALRKQQASQGLAVQVLIWLCSCFLLCNHERAKGTRCRRLNREAGVLLSPCEASTASAGGRASKGLCTSDQLSQGSCDFDHKCSTETLLLAAVWFLQI